MPLNLVILLIILFLTVLLWHNFSRAREHAIHECRKFCREMDYQLLDETVALIGIHPARNQNGRLVATRFYRFEISTDGYQRYSGEIELVSDRVKSIYLYHPDGIIIHTPETKTTIMH